MNPSGTRRPRWLPTLAALVTVVLCVMAGNWQHRRMLEKEALRDAIARAAAMAPVALPTDTQDWTAWRFRSVVATGEYDAGRQILIDNKVHDGKVGFDVVTPLQLADGRAVLVDRGFVPLHGSRANLPSAPPPTGPVDVRGRIDIPPSRYFELGNGSAPSGIVWEHLDPQRFAKASGLDVLPIVIEATDSRTSDGLVHDFPLPDTGIERHVSYMVQWYTFAAMAAGLWAWFTFRPRLRLRARAPR
ncbi:MAG TPA: SURF1 family protein [Casimicrobiaceae bacterium]|nr:SURF1 family protein [Casimicrobiaceae bacterium]